MLKDKLYIIDNIFGHAYSSSWHNKPKNFEWVRTYNKDCIVITDNNLNMVDQIDSSKKYGWLLESPRITPHAYEYIKNNYNKFDKVFTFSKELLMISDKFAFIPYGGCWIKEEDRLIHNKNKNVSIILSSKKTTEGHKLRHLIHESFPNIDYFGFKNPIDNKISGLKDYRFSVVVENCKEDFYFSEKLIDCFITGTIPIYWGCPSIGDFFDTNGMLIFNTLDELYSITNNINEEFYLSKLESIKHNFEEAKKYLVADNLIYEKIKEK